MNKYVIDTQAMVQHLVGESQVINSRIDRILRDADSGGNIIIIPAVVAFEIAYLYEKSRIPISSTDLRCLLENASNYVEEPLSVAIIECSFTILDIPELHDRLIAGTAKYIDAPVLTNDPVILESEYVQCV